MLSSVELTLGNLNQDVVRLIIQVGQEHVDSMRLISPKWNNLVQEHLGNRKNLPVIEYIGWSKYIGKLSMRIRDRFRNFFGAEKWEIRYNYSTLDNEYVSDYTWRSDDEFKSLVHKITPIFERCSAISMLDLTFLAMDNTEELNVIKKGIRSISIKQLGLNAPTLDNAELLKDHIFNIIEDVHVRCLIVFTSFASTDFDTIIPVFVDLLQLFESIELVSVHQLNAGIDYSFELKRRYIEDFHNSRLIIAMLLMQLAVNPTGPALFDFMTNPPVQMHPQIAQFLENCSRIECDQFTNTLNSTQQLIATKREQQMPSGGGVMFCIRIVKE